MDIRAQDCLARKEYQKAIDAAVELMRNKVKEFGKHDIQVVPSYLVMIEAHLMLDHEKQTEEFLSTANWCVVKSGDVHHEYTGKLNVLHGRLLSKKGNANEAIQRLAMGIYHLSNVYGPEDIETSFGYFSLGVVFHQLEREEECLALFDKVVDVWYKYAASVRTENTIIKSNEILRALRAFDRILDLRIRMLGPEHIATGEARFTMGLLYLYIGKQQDASKHTIAALDIYREQLGEEHPLTLEIQSVHDQLNHDEPNLNGLEPI